MTVAEGPRFVGKSGDANGVLRAYRDAMSAHQARRTQDHRFLLHQRDVALDAIPDAEVASDAFGGIDQDLMGWSHLAFLL